MKNILNTFAFKVVANIAAIIALAVFGSIFMNMKYQVATQSKTINNWIPLTSRVQKLHDLRINQAKITNQIEVLQTQLDTTSSGIAQVQNEINLLLNK